MPRKQKQQRDLPMEMLYDIFGMPNPVINIGTHSVSKRKGIKGKYWK